ncbi:MULTISPECIES: flagellar basal-body MS-ring/collar protein FliF [unclassified Methylobacterium]|jgi:flagellar M-ring protein FliF|uniref:flagellar basal-body MS-ring/collar protein FliF n=1 Tax=unclassified Methylobacterium TaxID=2615210 RepID=UPI001355AA2B|nr:flagellar basal-body MS-ring/collar protein FliF [Methylobacterium sp. 2A]MWV25116.1 flagellar M-ring protein FliF [Methylobacterium sp. 2A]
MPGRAHFEKLWQNILELGPRRLIALGLVGLTVFLAVGLGAYYLSRPLRETLYAGLNRDDVTRMGAVLKDAGIPFDVSADGTSLLVSYGQTAQARMLLAEKGLPQSGKAGYELFNDLGSLGLTSFMQDITRVRALEGELARTIQTLKGVKAARVHIVMPDPGSFRREQQPATASVVVRTEPANDPAVAPAIRQLVAAAIPGMKPDKVTVLNTDGTVLLAGDDATTAPAGRLAGLEQTINREIQDNIRRTLTPYLGPNNFEVSVVARLNTDKTKTDETIYNPDQKVERSVRTVKESESSQNRAPQKPTTAQQNVPGQNVQASGNESSNSESQRREELSNFEVSTKTVQTVSDGYSVKNLSVAVLVNRTRLESLAGAAKDGAKDAAKDSAKIELEPQITEIEQLVASASGFNKARGDQIKVAAVSFVNDGQPLTPVPALSFTEVLMRQSGTLINAATILIVGCLLIWFGLRPAVNAILARSPEMGTELALATPDEEAALAALQAEQAALASVAAAAEQPNLIEDLTDQMARSPIRRLEQLVELDEEQVANILKQWLTREEAA